MVTRLTQKYKITCDRCGKTEICDEFSNTNMGYNIVQFGTELRTVAKGEVCDDCYEDFLEIAKNFFDEVNRVNEDGPDDKPEEKPQEKPDAIIIIRESNNFFGEYYKCPLCGGTFGSWEVDKKDVRCPHCKAELGGVT